MNLINDCEDVARLLFYDQMIDRQGNLKPNAFPTEELLQKNNKNVSLDRCKFFKELDQVLSEKAKMLQNPQVGRFGFGYCVANVDNVRAITTDDGKQVFEVFEDPIEGREPVKVWHKAHAKLHRSDKNFTKAMIRGYRDSLIKIFSQNISQFKIYDS